MRRDDAGPLTGPASFSFERWRDSELAAQLYLGEGTIKTHVSHVLAKLGLRDRVQAVVFAYESGLAEPGED